MAQGALAPATGESRGLACAPQPSPVPASRPSFSEFAADIRLIQFGHGYPYSKCGRKYAPMSYAPTGGWQAGTEELPPFRLGAAEIQEVYTGALVWGWRAFPGARGNAVAIVDIDFHEQRQPFEDMFTLGTEIGALLAAAGLPARYINVSSTDAEGKSGGLHIIWVCEELISYELLEQLNATGLGIFKTFVEGWAAAKGTTAKFDLAPGNANFVRFALSAHPVHARGSESISFGPRLAASAVARLATPESGGISAKSKPKRPASGPSMGNTAKTANANNTTTVNTLLALPLLQRSGSLRQGIAKLLRQWEHVSFAEGESNALVNALGAACFFYGLPALEMGGCTAQQVIEAIIDRAQENNSWHCKESPARVAQRAYLVFAGLLQRRAEGYGKGLAPAQSLSISMGLIEALLKRPLKARAVVWLCYVLQRIHPRGRLEAPLAKLADYMCRATGEHYDAKEASRIRKKHLIEPGLAVLIDRYIPHKQADSFEVHWPEAWLQGSTISQAEAEDRLGLPHTYGLLAALNMEWDDTVLPKIAPPLAPDAKDDTAATSQDTEAEDRLPEVTEECRDTEAEHRSEPLMVLPPRAEIHSPVSHHPAAEPVFSVAREISQEAKCAADS